MKTEERLIRFAIEGDRDAFEELVEKYKSAVYALAYEFTRNVADAEDISQEAFIKAYLNLPTLRDKTKFAAWLYRITRSLCVDWQRKQARKREVLLNKVELGEQQMRGCGNFPKTPEEELEKKELREIILTALDSLSETNRLTTMMYYMDGLSYREIASFQNVPISTVKGRLYQARKQLERELITLMETTLKSQAPDDEFTRLVRTTTSLFKLPDDFVMPHGEEFTDEMIRRENMHLEFGGMRTPAFQYVKIAPLTELEDGKIEHIGPDVDDVATGAKLPLGIVIKIAGQKMQPAFESIFEWRIHDALSCVSGVWHRGERDNIWIRISREAKEKGLRIKHLGDIIYAMIHGKYNEVVNKVEVYLYTEKATVVSFLKESCSAYKKREERLEGITDENTDTFYSCLFCQPFTPHHICIITPERPGLCGRYSWLEAKANHQLEPMGVNRPVKKGKTINELKGQWQGINDYVATVTKGAINRLNIYSMMEYPISSCTCLECLSVRLPLTDGVMIVNREYRGMTPYNKMKFSNLVGELIVNGKQIEGAIAHSKRYISSRKYISGDGGFRRIVWMPKMLKDEIGTALNALAKTAGTENFVDMIADEEKAITEESVLEYMRKVNHPALVMESML